MEVGTLVRGEGVGEQVEGGKGSRGSEGREKGTRGRGDGS